MSNQQNQSAQCGVVTQVDVANKSISITTPSTAGKLQMAQDMMDLYGDNHKAHIQAQVDALRNQMIYGSGIWGINPTSYGAWQAMTLTPEQKAKEEEEARVREINVRERVMALFLSCEPVYREAFLTDHRSNYVSNLLDEEAESLKIYIQGYYFKLRDFEDAHANSAFEDSLLAVVN